MLISLITSLLDNFFSLKSLTIKCILSSNKNSYLLRLLIDTKVAKYMFINNLTI